MYVFFCLKCLIETLLTIVNISYSCFCKNHGCVGNLVEKKIWNFIQTCVLRR